MLLKPGISSSLMGHLAHLADFTLTLHADRICAIILDKIDINCSRFSLQTTQVDGGDDLSKCAHWFNLLIYFFFTY